jgi:NAD(P) transhydrogenase subunit alpha
LSAVATLKAPSRETAIIDGVTVIGVLNMPGQIAASASLLYAKNLLTFLDTMIDKESKTVSVDLEDELVKATALTHGGAVIHPAFGGETSKGAA